jgi:hypothetical protein
MTFRDWLLVLLCVLLMGAARLFMLLGAALLVASPFIFVFTLAGCWGR